MAKNSEKVRKRKNKRTPNNIARAELDNKEMQEKIQQLVKDDILASDKTQAEKDALLDAVFLAGRLILCNLAG
mgnify:CR=1 FL=1